MFSSWLPLSHSQRVVSFLTNLGVLLCIPSSAGTPDLGNEGHGTGARCCSRNWLCLLKAQRQNEAGRFPCSGSDDLSASPKPKMVLGNCWRWLCFDWPEQGNSYIGSETHHASTIMCHLVDFQWFPPSSVVGEQRRAAIPPTLLDIRVGRE